MLPLTVTRFVLQCLTWAPQTESDRVGHNSKAGDIVMQHGPSDIEAQEYKRLCTGSVYNAAYFDFMKAYVG